MRLWVALAISAALLRGQQTTAPQQKDSIVVTGAAEPVPLAEADRDVGVLPLPEKQRELYNSWFDLLQFDSALDLQQRALGGFQGDLSIRGATFGQTLVLLDGLRINDVQTGHFNLDLPIPLEMLSEIEVLKGSGSTLYGSDAIGGVVNVRTQPIEPGEFRLLAGAGNFGVNEEHAVTSFGRAWWQEELAFARDFSSGFMPDRDYRNLALSSLSTLRSRLGATSLLFAYSDRPFGANDFYGTAEPQWERTKTWFASGHQDLGKKTEANFAFRKHTDLYVYVRDDPALYTNWHTDEGWQGNLRRHDNLPLHGVLSYGMEGLAESIHSTNLGIHSRERASGYVFYDLRSIRRYSLSAGIREEIYGARAVATSPSLSGAIWITSRFKFRAAATRAFRLPSYTDIYYSSPSTLGNVNLKPESATSYEGGADAYLRTNLHASITVFDRRDTNVVDYVEPAGSIIYQAENLPPLRFLGAEASVVYEPAAGQHLAVSFSALHGQYASPQNLVTEYTFNYPVHDAIVEWRGTIAKNFIARTRLGVLNRVATSPYAIWDASMGYATGRVRPFLQLTNITSTVYEETPLIAMPKRGVIGGVELYIFGASR
ncbi:MAG TPA: TonB-dependent receptor [Bryobacteraceae bacterium]|jgi:iron complex outermembrane receptor protein|nr:TonB-dependent receptor [Bryobacteraceae bacterium]